MNIDLQSILGLSLMGFAAWAYFVRKKGGKPVEQATDKVEELLGRLGLDIDLPTNGTKQDKIELLKKFVRALDPEKDKDKIDYIVENFGLDFLKEQIYDNNSR